MRNYQIVSHAELLRVLDYCHLTGLFRWKVTLSNRAPAGSVAGHISSFGYGKISIANRTYPAHKLAIYYYSGIYPHEDVDHRDANPQNNAIYNLRAAGPLVNAQNRRRPSRNNKSGLLGVYLCSTTGRWRSSIRANGKTVRLGRFDTSDEAHAAYIRAKRELHKGNTL